MSYPDFVDFRNKNRSFDGLTAFQLSQFGFAPNKQVLPEMKAGLCVVCARALASNERNRVARMHSLLAGVYRPESSPTITLEAASGFRFHEWKRH